MWYPKMKNSAGKENKLFADVSNLKHLKDSKLKNDKVKARLRKIYDLERKTIVETMEELKQWVTTTAKKMERYDRCLKQYRKKNTISK